MNINGLAICYIVKVENQSKDVHIMVWQYIILPNAPKSATSIWTTRFIILPVVPEILGYVLL